MFLTKYQWLHLNDFHTPSSTPQLPCPYCLEESLTLDVESLSVDESPAHRCHIAANRSIAETKRNREALGGDGWKLVLAVTELVTKEEATPGIFHSTLYCQDCGGVVLGIGSAIYRSNKNFSTVAVKHEYFCPSVPLFEIASSVPESIRQELLQAFNYFHSDISTAGFKLRRAIERVCEELGYKGKNLHQCIDLMADKHNEEAIWLKALKLVGNEATHANGVNASDLLDAFAVFPGVLQIFERQKFSKDASEKVNALHNKFSKQLK
ncbi:Hypothetical protein mma_0933 [Janthinobacterium sp. Marseille]|uniref:DUF4145 domain-containing protein n=1 Tax=Herminiimonas aquatilis TaxID=345342 RepID=A0ABW2J5I5_9BURK|nr:DUF4145 domain-containing protein [Janthinobacterium sp. Marseille]ABR91698.1 Hypothetical protein mma_0933 [Janthinobacterium sp. Marseille]